MKRYLFLLTLLVASPSFAAQTFFDRCEGTTLNATHDFSAADTTGATGGTPVIPSATAAIVGSNGCLFDSATDLLTYSAASIASPTVGSACTSLNFPSAFPASSGAIPLYFAGTNANDYIRIDTLTGGGASNRNLRLSIRNNGGASQSLDLTGSLLAPATNYVVCISWDSVTPSRFIGVYNQSTGVVVDSASSGSAFTAPADLLNIHRGDLTGSTGTLHMDNLSIGSASGDYTTFVTNRNVDSYTLIGGSSAVPVIHQQH